MHQFTVVATSKDGQTASQTVTYTVIAPSNRAQIVKLTVLRNGTIVLWEQVPGPGSVNVFASAGKTNLANGASLRHPAANQFTFARGHSRVRRAMMLKLRIAPWPAGRRLVTSRAYPVLLRVWLTYTPEYGTARTTVRAVRVPGT